MLKSLGIEQYLDMKEISEQLNNITDDNILEAEENVKGLLGDVDEGTSNIVTDIFKDIANEFKKENDVGEDAFDSVYSIAENVAKSVIPKIDGNNFDIEKIWKSTQNMANNYTDKNGNKLFQGDMNPMNMMEHLKNMMSQMPQPTFTTTKTKKKT